MTLNITIPENINDTKPKISVIGIGGAGGNAENNYSFPDHTPVCASARSLISDMLQHDPAKRPSLDMGRLSRNNAPDSPPISPATMSPPSPTGAAASRSASAARPATLHRFWLQRPRGPKPTARELSPHGPLGFGPRVSR